MSGDVGGGGDHVSVGHGDSLGDRVQVWNVPSAWVSLFVCLLFFFYNRSFSLREFDIRMFTRNIAPCCQTDASYPFTPEWCPLCPCQRQNLPSRKLSSESGAPSCNKHIRAHSHSSNREALHVHVSNIKCHCHSLVHSRVVSNANINLAWGGESCDKACHAWMQGTVQKVVITAWAFHFFSFHSLIDWK